ncbi:MULTISPECIES: hypothetical protein [Clostridium]|uniref:Uncharacterized protein n=2 Tax=Clostridium TaxID=1485 RepID=A0AAX0AYI8_CLOBE|nr:hypothetical protein [Clostridium beijerinckii]NOW03793.1 hypothetical protein [Clostridium beijerinckii]NRT34732.1 hypothetical protein [Clostridium beijerinckii]NRT45839.1 hypothetical protein [Clostridium beijerinckii]NRT71343.1 hypothetical protein [Clostridium beijerinckii]
MKHDIGVVTGKRKDGTDAIQNVEMSLIPEGDVYRLTAKSELQVHKILIDKIIYYIYYYR